MRGLPCHPGGSAPRRQAGKGFREAACDRPPEASAAVLAVFGRCLSILGGPRRGPAPGHQLLRGIMLCLIVMPECDHSGWHASNVGWNTSFAIATSSSSARSWYSKPSVAGWVIAIIDQPRGWMCRKAQAAARRTRHILDSIRGRPSSVKDEKG